MQNTHPKMVIHVQKQPAYFFPAARVNSSMFRNQGSNMAVSNMAGLYDSTIVMWNRPPDGSTDIGGKEKK